MANVTRHRRAPAGWPKASVRADGSSGLRVRLEGYLADVNTLAGVTTPNCRKRDRVAPSVPEVLQRKVRPARFRGEQEEGVRARAAPQIVVPDPTRRKRTSAKHVSQTLSLNPRGA